ncbi:MAG: hypothetical protein R3C16_12935 [Hyphomonadaceae bacterium]
MPLRPPQIRLPQINHKMAALVATGVVAAIALASVQLFGDPDAAGPRRVVSLEPNMASADSAPRISFSDAASEGAELTPYGLDDLPPYTGARSARSAPMANCASPWSRRRKAVRRGARRRCRAHRSPA